MSASVEENTFKLNWSVDRFSLYENSPAFKEKWMMINPIPVGVLKGTEWAINFCLRTESDHIACRLQRSSKAAEVGDVSFEYFVSILGKDGLVLYGTEGIVEDLCPNEQVCIDIAETDEMPSEWLTNDRLCIVCEIRRVRSRTHINIGSAEWEDELKVLSEDMGRLLETGYLSDVRLMGSDGSSFPAHFSVLFARCHQLYESLRNLGKRPSVIYVPQVTGLVLQKFLSYIYTGTVSASDVTTEFFEMVATRTRTRERFYTLPQQMRAMTDHKKEHIAFTCQVDVMSSVDVYRVLPVAILGELVVGIWSADACQSCLAVEFSTFMLPPNHDWFQLHCTVTVIRRDGRRYSKSADHIFEGTDAPWRFPNFVPLRDERIRMEFELTVITGPNPPYVKSAVTEFNTGSLDVHHVELLASEMWSLFLGETFQYQWDAQLNTEGGFFPVSKAILGIRSEAFRNLFHGHETNFVSFYVYQSDPITLSSVLGYLYTGWTRITSVHEALKICTLAKRMSLHGLVRKCEQFVSDYAGGRLI